MKSDLKFDFFHICINILCFISLLFVVRHCYSPLIDIGRELYYSDKILSGSVLIKDLSSLFFPLSYYINSFFFKVLGNNLNTFYFLGIINSFLFINAIYLILRQFCSNILCFSLSVVAISFCIYTPNIMSFHMPYCWSLTYGLVAFLWSIYFLIKYFNNKNKTLYLYVCVFLCSLAFAFKYEFLLYGLIIAFLCIKNKKYFLPLFLPLPLMLSYLFLFALGLKIDDVIAQFALIANMFLNKYSIIFYKCSGVNFSFGAINISALFLAKTSILFFIFLNISRVKKLPYKIILYMLLVVLTYLFYRAPKTCFYYFSYVSILLVILYVICFPKLSVAVKIVTLSLISFCIKNFWGVYAGGYGNFFAPIAIMGIVIIFSQILSDNSQKKLVIFLVLSGIYFTFLNFKHSDINYPILSSKGKIFTYEETAYNTNKLIDYILKNTKPTDTVVVMPMGHIINYLTKRDTSNFYNYFSPEYLESYGEENVVKEFEKNKPDYFVITNQETALYLLRYFCKDYALKLCNFVYKNYEQIPLEQMPVDNDYRSYYYLFKLRKNDK